MAIAIQLGGYKMSAFLEQYGVAIFVLVIIAILVAFASPVGKIIKTAINTQVKNVDRMGNDAVTNRGN